jgi:hypothetical protein
VGMMNGEKIIIIRNYLTSILLIVMIAMMISRLHPYNITPQEISKPEEVIFLRNPTYGEAVWFLQNNPVSEKEYVDEKYVCYHFARDTAIAAEEYGIRCHVVILFEENVDRGHAIIAFDTTDWGLQYFNPQNDKNIKPTDWVYG